MSSFMLSDNGDGAEAPGRAARRGSVWSRYRFEAHTYLFDVRLPGDHAAIGSSGQPDIRIGVMLTPSCTRTRTFEAFARTPNRTVGEYPVNLLTLTFAASRFRGQTSGSSRCSR